MRRLPNAVLLDTCAAIWLANAIRWLPRQRPIRHASLNQGTLVSPISAWEIALLSRPRSRFRTGLLFLPDPKVWFARFLTGPGIREAMFNSEIAIDASYLPGELHSDPGDRLLVATARHLGVPIVTRDRPIIDYGMAGFVRVIAC